MKLLAPLIGLVSACSLSCGCEPERYGPAGYWQDFYPVCATYGEDDDELMISFSGGSLLPRGLYIRRYQTSGGLAMDGVGAPMWAKMDTFMYARVSGLAQLQQPATVSFEIWQVQPPARTFDSEWRAEKRRQRIELLISPPPAVAVTCGGRTVPTRGVPQPVTALPPSVE